jgi:hypothetical protein
VGGKCLAGKTASECQSLNGNFLGTGSTCDLACGKMFFGANSAVGFGTGGLKTTSYTVTSAVLNGPVMLVPVRMV